MNVSDESYFEHLRITFMSDKTVGAAASFFVCFFLFDWICHDIGITLSSLVSLISSLAWISVFPCSPSSNYGCCWRCRCRYRIIIIIWAFAFFCSSSCRGSFTVSIRANQNGWALLLSVCRFFALQHIYRFFSHSSHRIILTKYPNMIREKKNTEYNPWNKERARGKSNLNGAIEREIEWKKNRRFAPKMQM